MDGKRKVTEEEAIDIADSDDTEDELEDTEEEGYFEDEVLERLDAIEKLLKSIMLGNSRQTGKSSGTHTQRTSPSN